MNELKHYPHCVGQNTYHFQWTTKYRDERFRSIYRRKICEGALKLAAYKYGMRIIALRVMLDHVHMFVELKPSMPPSKAIGLFKGISSRMLRRHVAHLAQEKALWSPGKFIRSIGAVTAETIEHYITQSAHNQYDQQAILTKWG